MIAFKLDQIACQSTLIAFNQEMKIIFPGKMLPFHYSKEKRKKISQAEFHYFQPLAYLDPE